MIPRALSPSARQRALGLGLVILLFAIYLLTYNGYADSRDEWFLFDATESIARRGNLEQNFEFDAYPPTSLQTAQPPPVDAEPLQPVLAAPLFLLAQALPGIGLAHMVWLFNALVTALTAGVLFAYGLALGYQPGAALVVGIAFGLGTIAWPYSRTFFREPLFTVLALLCMLSVLRLRQGLSAGQRALPWLSVLVLSFAGMLLSKEASLLVVPALIFQALPTRRITRRTVAILAALLIVVALLLVLVLHLEDWFGLTITRWNLDARLDQARSNLEQLSDGVRGYLFSPARSLWLFSPVLLLGIFAWPRLIRNGRLREVLVPLVLTASFITGYAIIRGSAQWYGGLGWGPRYLVPLTPFLALWLLPLAERLLAQRLPVWARAAVLSVLLFSVAIQVLAALVPIHAYYDRLAAEQPPIIPWEEGTWSLRWSPLVVSIELLGEHTPDIAWLHAADPAWIMPGLASALAACAGAVLIWLLRRPAVRRAQAFLASSGLLLATGVAVLGALTAIRQDPRYYGDFAPTRDLLAQLDKVIAAGDVIVLNDPTYAEFFMNAYKRRQPTIYTLPLSPGERYSPEQAPEVISPNPDELIHPSISLILADLAQRHDRLWLVINSSPFIPWSVRPVEHYLARHYFPVRELQASDIARAVLFDLTPAPPPTGAQWPEHRSDAVFGDTLRLAGFDLPAGTVYAPGDVLPVSLLWETLATPPADYTVALYLIGPDGALLAQRDSFPVNHFALTSAWRPGSLHRDHHGLALPAALAPGDYQLWLALYWWQAPQDRLPVRASDGAGLGDHLVLATISIE